MKNPRPSTPRPKQSGKSQPPSTRGTKETRRASKSLKKLSTNSTKSTTSLDNSDKAPPSTPNSAMSSSGSETPSTDFARPGKWKLTSWKPVSAREAVEEGTHCPTCTLTNPSRISGFTCLPRWCSTRCLSSQWCQRLVPSRQAAWLTCWATWCVLSLISVRTSSAVRSTNRSSCDG